MTKLPITKKPGEVIAFNPPPFFKALDRLANDADRVLQHYERIERLITALNDGREINLAACKRTATLNKFDEATLARCREALQKFDPDSAYVDGDREDGLRPSLIAERMALLVDSKSKGRPPNPGVYAELMMQHLLAIDGLSLIALDAAFREIRETKPYVPEISDLMPVLREHQLKWEARRWAIFSLAETSRDVLDDIETLEVERKRAVKLRSVYEARQLLEQAQLAAIDAEDSRCDASRAFQNADEAFVEAKRKVLEREEDLARAEANCDA